MSDWVHCNKCMNQPKAGIKFVLTQCGHLLCGKCLPANMPPQAPCVVCQAKTGYMEISRQMNKEIQSYFSDPKELSKRQSSMMDQVLTFQSRQRERYVKALRSALKSAALRQQQLQEQIKQLSETNSKLVAERDAYMQENTSLKEALKRAAQTKFSSPYQRSLDAGLPSMSRSKQTPIVHTPSNAYGLSFSKVVSSTPILKSGGGAQWRDVLRSAKREKRSAHESQDSVTTQVLLTGGLNKDLSGSSRSSRGAPPLHQQRLF